MYIEEKKITLNYIVVYYVSVSVDVVIFGTFFFHLVLNSNKIYIYVGTKEEKKNTTITQAVVYIEISFYFFFGRQHTENLLAKATKNGVMLGVHIIMRQNNQYFWHEFFIAKNTLY